ncbi:hypothetical protein IAT40_004266 [Kwoniella sp. CBS 6097]
MEAQKAKNSELQNRLERAEQESSQLRRELEELGGYTRDVESKLQTSRRTVEDARKLLQDGIQAECDYIAEQAGYARMDSLKTHVAFERELQANPSLVAGMIEDYQANEPFMQHVECTVRSMISEASKEAEAATSEVMDQTKHSWSVRCYTESSPSLETAGTLAVSLSQQITNQSKIAVPIITTKDPTLSAVYQRCGLDDRGVPDPKCSKLLKS